MQRTPVVFVHGPWLHALSWQSWARRFAHRGYLPFLPRWPGEAATAREARTRPGAPGGGPGLDALTEHYTALVRSLAVAPVLVGHSAGGLIAQRLLGAGAGRAAVALAPAPINGVPLPAPPAWREGGPEGPPAVLSPRRFRRLFANTVGAEESGRLFERYVVPAPYRLLADLGRADADPHPRARADTGNTARGPLLLVSGQEDLLVPDAVTRAVYKLYGDSTAVTDLKQFADRGHSLVVDSGWRQVADHVLDWLHERGVRALSGDG
ncbi:alpha/beta hydrolase [Streptomyces seoulensis]|nr:alpha/beta hydrolase [Streptomyces seoulensis]